jgi:hypothetical protein
MAELGWTVSEVTQEHLQNHVSQGYMTVVELVTCRVPEDPTSPVQAGGGCIVPCTAFYRCGVWCAIRLVSLLFAIVLWPGAASLDPLGDLAHVGLCDPIRCLYGD